MKKLISLFLIVSLLSFTSCTTLTAAEHCALAGQALEGMIASPHHPLATNKSTYGLPVCKVAKTEEEKISGCGFNAYSSREKYKEKGRVLDNDWWWISLRLYPSFISALGRRISKSLAGESSEKI